MTISPVVLFSLSPLTIVLIIVAVITIGLIIFLAIWGNKQQKKMDETEEQIAAAAQTVTMLVIDKKKMRFSKAGLPKMIVDSTPWYARLAKIPVVKAKVGPKVMVLISDSKIFDMIPIKQEIKATVSGIYITKVRSLRGPALVHPKKKKFREKMADKANELRGKTQTANTKNTKNTKNSKKK